LGRRPVGVETDASDAAMRACSMRISDADLAAALRCAFDDAAFALGRNGG
jgi:hypothetical protein